MLQARQVVAHPVWLPGTPVHSAGTFEGVLRHCLTAFKDENRRDLAPWLAQLLRSAVAEALAQAPIGVQHWRYVLVPSSPVSMRSRGRFPLGELARCLEHGPGLHQGPALRLRRHVREQSRLSRQQRRENLLGAHVLAPGTGALPTGTGIVLVDDVVTTGATLAAARAAVAGLEPEILVAATIAATGAREHPVRGSVSSIDGCPRMPARREIG